MNDSEDAPATIKWTSTRNVTKASASASLPVRLRSAWLGRRPGWMVCARISGRHLCASARFDDFAPGRHWFASACRETALPPESPGSVRRENTQQNTFILLVAQNQAAGSRATGSGGVSASPAACPRPACAGAISITACSSAYFASPTPGAAQADCLSARHSPAQATEAFDQFATQVDRALPTTPVRRKNATSSGVGQRGGTLPQQFLARTRGPPASRESPSLLLP